MGLLDDTAIFAAVIQQGGFSHAAKHLGLSNGLISRRIAQLEADLGVTLLKRTTRQIQLTPEGELFWQHAQRIQQELDSALTLIQSLSQKPTGTMRISSPVVFGKRYLTPIILKFMENFPDIRIELVLTNKRQDPIKENLDLTIRGVGFVEQELHDSNLHMKILIKQKIYLYAGADYIAKRGVPLSAEELPSHGIISFSDKSYIPEEITWNYLYKNKQETVTVHPRFYSNDMEACMQACLAGQGIGKFTELFTGEAVAANRLIPILSQYDWGDFNLYAVYPHQQTLPKRTRLLLEFIVANLK